jgi:hypothetical protein
MIAGASARCSHQWVRFGNQSPPHREPRIEFYYGDYQRAYYFSENHLSTARSPGALRLTSVCCKIHECLLQNPQTIDVSLNKNPGACDLVHALHNFFRIKLQPWNIIAKQQGRSWSQRGESWRRRVIFRSRRRSSRPIWNGRGPQHISPTTR